MARLTGLEPVASRLEGGRSFQLSYRHIDGGIGRSRTGISRVKIGFPTSLEDNPFGARGRI